MGAAAGQVLNDTDTAKLNPKGCIVKRATAQSIPTGTFVQVGFDAIEFDNDVMTAGAAAGNLIIKTPGVYDIKFAGSMGSIAFQVIINIAGFPSVVMNATTGRINLSESRLCAANDGLAVYIRQDTGAAVNLDPGDFPPRLSIIRQTGS